MTGIPTNGPLVADSLVLRYGTVSALNNCSADFPGLGLFSIVGLNGSGKSSLFDVASGFVAPSSGCISIAAQGAPLGIRQLRRRSVRLHQRLVLPSTLSVGAYLRICASPSVASALRTPPSFFRDALPSSSPNSFISSLLASAGLGVDSQLDLDRLSWGQRRIAAICGVLLTRKPWVLLDEPFAGLSRKATELLLDALIFEARLRLVVYVEHELEFALQAQEILVMREGKILVRRAATQISREEILMNFGRRL